MTGPEGASTVGGESATGAVDVLRRLRDLSREARTALDAGDTEGALTTIDRRAALFESERLTIERMASAHESQSETVPPTGHVSPAEAYRTLSDTMHQHSLLVARLREVGTAIADELARLETGRRTIRAYGRTDLGQNAFKSRHPPAEIGVSTNRPADRRPPQ